MNVKRVIDWLSVKQAELLPRGAGTRPAFLNDVEAMPCVCCFGEPDFLGMFEGDLDGKKLGEPEGDERVYFYMLCLDCAKRVDKKNIFEKLQAFSFQLTN